MKTQKFKRVLLVLAAGIFALLVWKAGAQSTVPVPVNTAPQLPYAVMEVVQLEQAKLSDQTVNAYIHNAGTAYVLKADQILYLKQQGVSDAVISALLTQQQTQQPPPPAPMPPPPAPAVATPTPPPTVTYMQPAPTVTYVQPPPVYYPYYYAPPAYYYGYPHPFFPSFGVGWGRRGWHAGVRF